MSLARLLYAPRLELEDHFEFVGRLGSGSTADVWMVRERGSGVMRALKLGREFCRSWRARWRRQRASSEGLVGQSLHHPRLVATLKSGWSRDNRWYLLLEYVDGQVLDVTWRSHDHSLRHERLVQLCDVLDAACYLHARGWVHRDICPHNVLIESAGKRAKLFDFGQTARSGSVVRVSELGRGTLNYAAPETLRAGICSNRADVFSAAVVVYEALTGHLPWPPAKTIKEFLAGLHAPLRRSSTVPQADPRQLPAILFRCLHPNPQQRPADLRELRDWVGRQRDAAGG